MVTQVGRIGRTMAGIIGTQTRPAALTPTDFAYAERTEALFSERDGDYELFQAYYDGHHSDPRDIAFGERERATPREFSHRHNYCAIAIDALVERLDITGWTGQGEGISEAQSADLETRIWGWWEGSDGPELQNTVHGQAFIKGDAFVMVDWDTERVMPRLTFHDALEVSPLYDAYHRPLAVYKRWEETWYDDANRPHTRRRITKYTDDLIEKYANEGKGWALYGGDVDSSGNPDGGVIVWRDRQGRPLGIPVFHFKNKARGRDFGVSELADLIPVQDELNRRIWFTSEAMSYQGAQQIALTNFAPPKGTNLERSPGKVWTLTSASKDQPVGVHVIPAGDVAALEAATREEEARFATISRTPMHLLRMEGNPPSGESLKVAEAPLTGKAADRITTFTGPWSDALTLAVRLENTFGAGGLPEDARVTPTWASVYSRSELSDEQRVQLATADLSWEERMRLRGYDAEGIEQIRAEMAESGSGAPGSQTLAALDQEFARMARLPVGQGEEPPADGEQP